MNHDFKAFNESISWFNFKNEPIEVVDSIDSKLTEEFKKTFPSLFALISISRKHSIKFKGDQFILYAWDKHEEGICGWLCKIENEKNEKKDLLPEHKLILQNIGGIQECFAGPDSTIVNGVNYNRAFTANQNFLFIESLCEDGFGDYQSYYQDRCIEENCEAIEVGDFLVFATEGNGDKTLYNKITTKVFLLLHDHDFNYVESLPAQPADTLYTIKGVKTFYEYIEVLAKQWIFHIKK